MSAMTEWYVVHTVTKQIVNCITSHDKPSLSMFDAPDDYHLDPNPPLSMLEKYEFWAKRP